MALVRQAAYDEDIAQDTHRDVDVMRRLQLSGLLQVPVDVYSVAEFLGLDVREEAMDDELSGFIEPRKAGWIIGVNTYHHPNRQRFTVAHEIGHFLLHKPTEKHVDVTFARRVGSKDPKEAQADRFAAELLMPEASVREAIGVGETSLERLAKRFNVSVLAAKYRVQSLGYAVR